MRIQLKTVLDCDPDAAWRALRSPAVLRELYGPFLQMASLETTGFPTVWSEERHEVVLRLGGVVPVGRQAMDLRLRDDRADGIRILKDDGAALTGPLSLLDSWTHRMAVSPAAGDPGKTLYRDRLDIHGPLAPAYWYPLWLTWPWRGRRIRQLAPTWAYDPRPEEETPERGETPQGDAEHTSFG